MFIDTHAHVNFNNFKKDADQVIRASLSEQTWMILIGTELKSSKRALEFANKYERGVYASIGLHPLHLFKQRAQGEGYDFETREEDFNYDIYEKLAKFEKVVAIGETGLDYYHITHLENLDTVKDKQKEVFWNQLFLARRLNKPVIIHCRKAHDDMIELLKKFRRENRELIPKNKPWGVMHCFSGDEDLAWKYFNLGMIISFTGLITFSQQWDDLIRKIPNDKFLIETDTPFMTPEPHRGKRNEPILVKLVAKRIAEIKGITLEKVAEISTRNAKSFFNI